MAVTFGPYSPWRRAGDLVVISGHLVSSRDPISRS